MINLINLKSIAEGTKGLQVECHDMREREREREEGERKIGKKN